MKTDGNCYKCGLPIEIPRISRNPDVFPEQFMHACGEVYTKIPGPFAGYMSPHTPGAPIDLINHPPHYTRLTPEPIDVIESWELNYHLGCAVKYIARAGKKEGAPIVQDLSKAAWYLNREIERLKKATENTK